jgi:hypothetical protein
VELLFLVLVSPSAGSFVWFFFCGYSLCDSPCSTRCLVFLARA